MIKEIIDNDILYAKIIRADENPDVNTFYTRDEDELQLGILVYNKDYKTGAHVHNRPQGFINETDEILIVLNGTARIDFYNNQGVYVKSSEVSQGDIIILYMGGHNINYTEPSKILMIKKGPYVKQDDSTRIVGANASEIIIDN